MADDEITRIEIEAIQKTDIEDWPGARTLFRQALALEMPEYRRAWILKSVALTYMKEGNRAAAAATAQRAITLLDSSGVSNREADMLRNELHNFSLASGELPLRKWWYTVVSIAGLYWGLSIASGATLANGAPMGPKLVLIAPPFFCLITAVAAVGGLNRRAVLGAITLYATFLFTFGIGYGLAASGLIRFGYKQR